MDRAVGIRELLARMGGRGPAREARCGNCGITIAGEDEDGPGSDRAAGKTGGSPAYCCEGCADGGPCIC